MRVNAFSTCPYTGEALRQGVTQLDVAGAQEGGILHPVVGDPVVLVRRIEGETRILVGGTFAGPAVEDGLRKVDVVQVGTAGDVERLGAELALEEHAEVEALPVRSGNRSCGWR